MININYDPCRVSSVYLERDAGGNNKKIFDDEYHSHKERREIIIGYSSKERLLIVIFIERKQNTIRIISARTATKKERKEYEENLS